MLQVTQPTPGATLDCDILVIGSGAGGSIVAAHLAEAGHDVIVAEKSGYAPTHTFSQREVQTLEQHFEAGGLLASRDGGISILAGSTLGGGTTINWAGSLRTPDYILEEWATSHANPHFLEKSYQEGFDFIEKRNSVSSGFRHNPQNQALLTAAQKLGWRAENIPMNMQFPADLDPETAWQAMGFSCYGDAYGIKQGAAQTFLHDAAASGARLFQHLDIQRIVIENGHATGAVFRSPTPEGHWVEGRIRARRVVVSAGALHTPVLLLKSGLRHRQIGRNLYLHPVATVAAFHPKDILPWYGPMMSVIVQEFTRLDQNWGVRIECPPIHPGLAAFALSWEHGEQFKRDMSHIRRLAVQLVLTRDRFGGRVTVGKKSGQPIIDYQLHPYDRKHLLQGMQACVRLHAQHEVERITVLHNQPLHFNPKKDNLEAILLQMMQKKWDKNRFGLFSAHQMGTCRMGGLADYPVQPNGETREVKGLFVADTSLFPAASGTNPMLSVQALASWVARHV
jgi:choline dehydrogenase-like flavoprotein